ncbi:MAG: tol-pal system-associated acyl-CoA thioesterase [Rhodoferax sp.]
MRAEPPKTAAFVWPLRVYWEDTDAGGIVFYANYLKYFERARTEWLRSLGLEQRALRDSSGGMFVVSEARLRYHRPARLDDELLVTAEPLEIARASLTIRQQALLKAETGNMLLCEASVRVGWVGASSYRPERIPSTLLQMMK